LSDPPRNYTDILNADADRYDRFRAAMLERSVHLLPEGRWYVSASHTDRELKQVLSAIRKSMATLGE